MRCVWWARTSNRAFIPWRTHGPWPEDLGLDLVEISPSADPPVCRIIDYKKFLYEQKKKQKELKAKQQTVEMKEIRFGPKRTRARSELQAQARPQVPGGRSW